MRIFEHFTIDAFKALVLHKALHVMRLRMSSHHNYDVHFHYFNYKILQNVGIH